MLLVVAACGLSLMPVRAQDAAPPPITTIPSDGFNMKVVDQPDPYHVVVTLDPPVFNWFAGTFTNLPTDGEVTIGLDMNGMDHPLNKADVSKWVGLKPVMTYGDPTKYETYEWFQKDDAGRWVSGDPFKQGEEKFAGTSKLPEQSVIPKELAGQFLSENGKYWQAWREIDFAEALPTLNIFRMNQKYSLPTVTVAMRVPYTYTYLQEYISQLRQQQITGVYVDEIGETIEGRHLQILRIDNSTEPIPMQIESVRSAPDCEPEYKISLIQKDLAKKSLPQARRVILIYAREHATEHASSWALSGMLKFLLDQPDTAELRNGTTWLIIPILDPDGSYHSGFDWLTTHFYQHGNDPLYGDYTPTETISYARYLSTIANGGYPIVIAASYHNVECNEGAPVFSPWGLASESQYVQEFNRGWFEYLIDSGIVVGNSIPLQQGTEYHRLFGWCWWQFRSLGLGFEVNDRFPDYRLNMSGINDIGASFVRIVQSFFTSEIGRQRMEMAIERAQNRESESKKRIISDQSNLYDLFVHGN